MCVRMCPLIALNRRGRATERPPALRDMTPLHKGLVYADAGFVYVDSHRWIAARDRIVLPSGSTDMVKAVKDAGGKNIRATIYEGVGHNSADKAWNDPALIDWLFKQKKTSP